jgi:multiple sugar transport system ATP-binding protein
MVAGLEEITEGQIKIGDVVVNKMPPRERDVAMVFQNYALYPHKSIYENLAFPLKLRGMSKREVEERVTRIARLLELEEQLKRRPRQLSGGQRQRVAMGRAIVREPQAFLMEIAGPQELYDRPANLFVAGFIGSPAMNFVEGKLDRADGALAVTVGDKQLAIDEAEVAGHTGLEQYAGRTVILGIRPEHLEDAALVPDTPANRRLNGHVRLKEALGSEIVVHFQVDAAPVVLPELRELTEEGVDESVLLAELDEHRRMRRTAFLGRFSVTTGVKEGGRAEIAISPGAMRFFDADSGRAIRT